MRLMIGVLVASGLVFGAGLAVAQNSASYMAPEGTPENIRSAIESDARTDEQRARDANRKPAEILALAGVEDGSHVIELASFGHYYTTLLVEAVGRDGHVDMVDMPWTDRFGGEGARAFDAAHENATYTQAHYNEVDLPGNVDAVTIVLFYHDLTREAADQSADAVDMNARIFAALKPGGTYLVIDHNAEDGSGWRDATTLHRIDAQTIIDEVTGAGFDLAVNSDLLANPADDRTLGMRDPAIRGHTDRAVLVFRKPM